MSSMNQREEPSEAHPAGPRSLFASCPQPLWSSSSNKVRFSVTQLIILVATAAFVFAILRHPESLWAAIVPLAGGLFVVLPVLGTAELLTTSESAWPELGWAGTAAVILVAFLGLGLLVGLGIFFLSLFA